MKTNPSSLQINECISFYLNNLLIKDYTMKTIDNKSENLRFFREWLHSQNIQNLQSVDLDVFEDYMAFLRNKKCNNKDKNLAPSTVRSRLTSVRVFIQFLTKREIVTHREVEKFELPTIGLILPKPILSYEDVLRIIKQIPQNTVKGIRDRAIVECFYASGIRRSELAALNLLDVDFSNYQLRVVQSKNKKDRYAPFGKTAGKWLKKYLRDVRPLYASLCSGNAFFLNTAGMRFGTSNLSSLMSKYIKKANINKTGACHQYRHAAATHMLDNEADIRHVQEFLGHASISTTQLYLHVSKAKLRRVYTKTHPRAD
ncbi:tyrosine-type recombinase/integrase [Glaciecola sp. SC05]|uniref:tyrosine-type recombinase/integrase n=1 Tax=Glaciecola sp. SC05 TaxID=1987355 RepID=UPI0035272090